MSLTVDTGTFLGPARVVRTAGKRALLAIADRQVWAWIALASAYEPAVDDLVLLVGQEESWYVIGVLEGSGRTSMTVPGDLVLRAPQGRIELVSGEAVKIRSPQVSIVAGKLELWAKATIERFEALRCIVKRAFRFRAGRARTSVDGDYRLQAERIVERAKGDVKIDGNKIHLG